MYITTLPMDPDQVLHPYFKTISATIGVFVLVAGLGVAIKLVQNRQNPFSKAGFGPVERIDLSVTTIHERGFYPKYGLSAQAVGSQGNVGGISYLWGVSSSDSIGNLSIHSSQRYAEFKLNGNLGRADIWVATDTGIKRSVAIAMGPNGPYFPTSLPNPPDGCYYQQVQCIQAPCDPILVCPSPSPQTTNYCKPNSAKTVDVYPSGPERCQSIQQAIDNTPDGGTVKIAPGQYQVDQTLTVANKRINIEGASGKLGDTTLNVNSRWGFLVENIPGGSLSWLSIKGSSANGMISVKNGTYSLSYLDVEDRGAHAIDFQGCDNCAISNSKIKSMAGALEVSNSKNFTASENDIYNSNTGIFIFHTPVVNLFNNLITNNSGDGILIVGGGDSNIQKNTVANSGRVGIKIDGPGVKLSKNIIFNSGLHGVLATNRIAHLISNNNFYSNRPNFESDYSQLGINGNISANPYFEPTFCLGNPLIPDMGSEPRCVPQKSVKIGDANGDGRVDGADYTAWLLNFGRTTSNRALDADFNEDGKVDGIDYSLWLNNYL